MSSFSTLTYVPPQTKGRMEYNVGLNNVLSNQTDGEKDVKITFPKLSFSLKDDETYTNLVFSPWKDSATRNELLLAFGIASNYAVIGDEPQEIMEYFQVADIPNAIITEKGAYFTIEDSLPALNMVLKKIFIQFGAQNEKAFYSDGTLTDKIYARIPLYRAYIKDNNFIFESDYALPIIDTSDSLDGVENFENYSLKYGWETTNVLTLPHEFDHKISDEIGISVVRGVQATNSENSTIDINTMQCYAIIPRGGIYAFKYRTLMYFLTSNAATQEVYSFLPWADEDLSILSIAYKGIHLDSRKTFLQILDTEPLYFSNGRYKNHMQDSSSLKGFFFLESKKHFFSFPMEKSTSSNSTLILDGKSMSDGNDVILRDYRFIHITYESGFFVPSYYVKGAFDGKQQLVNTNIVYSFDRIKDSAMFTSGDFYFDENAVQNMAYILTKMKYMGAYNVTIRVLGETYDGRVDVLNGSNFYFQMKFEYE